MPHLTRSWALAQADPAARMPISENGSLFPPSYFWAMAGSS